MRATRPPRVPTRTAPADPQASARQRLLLGMLGVGLGASALAFLTQLPQVDPLDVVALPLLFTALLAALLGSLSGRLDSDRGARLAYLALAAYMLVSLNYQLAFISPHTHTLSEATYWFAVVYCTAFMAWEGRAASRVAGLTFVLSLLSGLVGLIGMAVTGSFTARMLGYLTQFYAAGLASILLLYHITSLREHYGEVRRSARLDSLTGFYNRGYGEELLESACAGGRPLALILFDLDHFKQVNDLYGHQAGDRVLKAAARSVLDRLPTQGHAVRWGGEEFLLILPGLDQTAGRHLAELMRGQIATLHRVTDIERVTASFGVVVRRSAELPDALLRRADAALYRAKESGRNRVKTPTMF